MITSDNIDLLYQLNLIGGVVGVVDLKVASIMTIAVISVGVAPKTHRSRPRAAP